MPSKRENHPPPPPDTTSQSECHITDAHRQTTFDTQSQCEDSHTGPKQYKASAKMLDKMLESPHLSYHALNPQAKARAASPVSQARCSAWHGGMVQRLWGFEVRAHKPHIVDTFKEQKSLQQCWNCTCSMEKTWWTLVVFTLGLLVFVYICIGCTMVPLTGRDPKICPPFAHQRLRNGLQARGPRPQRCQDVAFVSQIQCLFWAPNRCCSQASPRISFLPG